MRRDHRSVVASMTNRWPTLVLPAEGRSDPVPGDGQQLYEVSSAEIDFAGTNP